MKYKKILLVLLLCLITILIIVTINIFVSSKNKENGALVKNSENTYIELSINKKCGF